MCVCMWVCMYISLCMSIGVYVRRMNSYPVLVCEPSFTLSSLSSSVLLFFSFSSSFSSLPVLFVAFRKTYTGTVLIAINPYRYFHLYDQRWINQFSSPPLPSHNPSLSSSSSSEKGRNEGGVCTPGKKGDTFLSLEGRRHRTISSRFTPHPFAIADFAYSRLIKGLFFEKLSLFSEVSSP